MRHLGIINKHAVNRMDISIEGGDILAFNHYARINQYMVVSHFSYLISQCVKGTIAIDIQHLSWLWLPYLQQSTWKHCLIVVVRFTAIYIIPLVCSCRNSSLILKHKLILCHRSKEYMIGNKHVQRIEAIRIVVTCADFQAKFAHIVIPLRGICIDIISKSDKVIKTVNAIGFHYSITLSENSVANLTFGRTIQQRTVSVITIGRLSKDLVLRRTDNRVCKTCAM